MSAEAGRDFSKLTIPVYHLADEILPKTEVAKYEKAGVHRLILGGNHLEPARADKEVEALARAYIS